MQASIDGNSVHYEVTGSGPWLTLSHSLATHLGMWDEQLEVLNGHFKVLRYDTRGHGGTAATAGPYHLTQLADDAAGLLKHLGVTRTHWLGLSMGGMIGQVLAMRHPQLLDRVILADTNAQVAAEGKKMWADRAATARSQGMQALIEGTMGRWFTQPFQAAKPARYAEISNMIRNTTVGGYAGCCAALAEMEMLEKIKFATQPALVIVGEQDQGTPVSAARAIAHAWPGAKLCILTNAAHLANVERPESFNDAVLRFLQ